MAPALNEPDASFLAFSPAALGEDASAFSSASCEKTFGDKTLPRNATITVNECLIVNLSFAISISLYYPSIKRCSRELFTHIYEPYVHFHLILAECLQWD